MTTNTRYIIRCATKSYEDDDGFSYIFCGGNNQRNGVTDYRSYYRYYCEATQYSNKSEAIFIMNIHIKEDQSAYLYNYSVEEVKL